MDENVPAPAEQPEEVEEREYVPSDDDGLTSIDDVEDGATDEVDEDDPEWGHDGLTDDEVATGEEPEA
jgi:hypothetical protein